MKKSELNKYIKENIISALSEDTDAEIAKTKELTSAIQDLEVAKKEAGIEEKVANTVDDVIDPADYGRIGIEYLKGFGKPHSLDLDQLETLGRKIVKQLYKGDFDKAKAKFIKEDLKEGNFDELKKHQDMMSKAADFFRDKAEELGVDRSKIREFNVGVNNLISSVFDADNKRSGGKIDENEDAEPTKADLKKTKGLAKAKEELALLTREMKSLAKKYSKAEGEDKEKLVKILKDKTKLKKELESILDK